MSDYDEAIKRKLEEKEKQTGKIDLTGLWFGKWPDELFELIVAK